MSTEEQKVLDTIAAAKAAGEDPFGDDEDVTTDAADEGDTTQDETQQDDDGNAIEPTAEAPESEPASTEQAEMPAYKAEMPADYKAQRAELQSQKAKAMQQLMDGEIDAQQFAVEESRVSDALEDLAATRIRAETLQEANTQAQQAYQARAIQRLIGKAKAEVDYAADGAAQKQFDTSLQVLIAQPDNAGKDFADLIEDAHQMVKAMRGVQAKAPTVGRKPAGDAPVTLRSLPSAATSNTGGVIEQIARLKGPAYEAAYAKLTPAQKTALLEE